MVVCVWSAQSATEMWYLEGIHMRYHKMPFCAQVSFGVAPPQRLTGITDCGTTYMQVLCC